MTSLFFREVLNWFLDAKCPLCNHPWFQTSLCPQCSQFTSAPQESNEPLDFSNWELDDKARALLHSIKYQGHFERLCLLKPLLPEELPRRWRQSVLIPVPLSQDRFWRRRFNQSEWLARELSKKWQLRMEPRGLLKVRETAAQSTLGRKQRLKNLKGVFQWNLKIPIPEKVILVDDVKTTGATLSACRKALEAARVKEIFSWTLFVKASAHVFQSS